MSSSKKHPMKSNQNGSDANGKNEERASRIPRHSRDIQDAVTPPAAYVANNGINEAQHRRPRHMQKKEKEISQPSSNATTNNRGTNQDYQDDDLSSSVEESQTPAQHRKPRHMQKKKKEISQPSSNATTNSRGTNQDYQDDNLSSSVEESQTPGAVRIPGVRQGTIEDEHLLLERTESLSQPPVAVVAELVPDTDDVQEENERLRQELQREREERDRQQQLIVVAGSAEPVLETKSKTLWLYGGVAILAAVGVIVGVSVSVPSTSPISPKPTNKPSHPPSMTPTKEPSPSHPPSMMPTKEPSASPSEMSRFDLFLDTFMAQNPNLGLDVFRDASTPQHQALTWLAEDDGMALDPEISPFALERFVLATWFFSTNGTYWINEHKFLQPITVCEWNNGDTIFFQGILCNKRGQVSTLRMEGNQVHGTMPAELVLLTDLTEIKLDGNRLSGTFPEHFGKLTALMHLEFNGNSLSGTFPEQIAELTALMHLDFYDTDLIGTIPNTLGELTRLTYLELGYNNRILGTIPYQLSRLTDLTHLGLNTNLLAGTFPSELGALTKLTYLSLRENYDLRGDLDFLCTSDFNWTYFSSDCAPVDDDWKIQLICSCCTVCYC